MVEGEESKKMEIENEIVVIGLASQLSGEQDKRQPTSLREAIDEDVEKQSSGDSIDGDTELAKMVTEKKLALVKAWEESEKSKAETKAYNKLSTIRAWENTKTASVELQLMHIQEELEKEKAIQVVKMRNKMEKIQKATEEKRALVEAKKAEDILKVEETASKFRTNNNNPITMKIFKCFGFYAS